MVPQPAELTSTGRKWTGSKKTLFKKLLAPKLDLILSPAAVRRAAIQVTAKYRVGSIAFTEGKLTPFIIHFTVKVHAKYVLQL